MDECFFLPRFQNESSCKTEFDLHKKEPVGESRKDERQLGNGLLDECRKVVK